jgi:predicted transcriptional regulator
MSTLSVRLPDSLHARAKELAEKDHISLNQMIANALAEKIAALETEDYLQARAAKGNRKQFDQVMAKVPSRPPFEGDEL